MANYKDLVRLALDSYKGRAVGKYSNADNMETLRQALIEANGGSTTLDYRAIRDGKCNGLFSIVEEIITKTVIEGLPESCPLFNYVDYKNLKDGDTNEFEIKGRNFKMLGILFFIVMILIFGNMMMFAIKMAWGITKVLGTLVFLPVFLIVLVFVGLLKLAFPILVIIGVISLFSMKWDS